MSCPDDQMSCPDHEVRSQEVLAYFGRRVFSKSTVLNCDLMVFFHTTAQAKIPPKLPFSLRTKVTSREDSEAPGSPLNNIRCLTHWWRNNPQLWLIAPPQPLSTTCQAWPDHLPFFGDEDSRQIFRWHSICEQWKVWIPLCFHYFLSTHPPSFPPFAQAIPETLLRQKARRSTKIYPNNVEHPHRFFTSF